MRQGEGLLLECRVNHTLNLIKRVTWGIDSTKEILCSYRLNARIAKGSKRCMQGRALTWWSANSSYFYINSTHLSDSGKYTCTAKITDFQPATSTKTVVVYSEYILVEAASFTGCKYRGCKRVIPCQINHSKHHPTPILMKFSTVVGSCENIKIKN